LTGHATPDALLRTANQLMMAGRTTEAIEAHQRLLKVRPELSESWYNLAYLQRSSRLFEQALLSYGEALARGIAKPEEVHVNRAVILSDHLQRSDEAEAELQAAIRIAPGSLLPRLNLGSLYEDLGDPDRARDSYLQALRIAPGDGRAMARLTAIDIFQGRAAEAPDQLSAALERPGLSLEDRSELSFALGNALDAAGRYEEAWPVFEKANIAARALAPQGLRYDPRAQEALVDGLVTLPARASSISSEEAFPRPLFICGMFRSGSTLAEQILARHSKITPGGELEIIPAIVSSRLQPYPQRLGHMSATLLDELRSSYLGELRTIHPDAGIVTDKRVDNFQHIGLIKAMFPTAGIVHTVREPLDNILSIYFLFFGTSVTYGWDLRDIAHWYQQYRRLMAHWQALYPDIHDLSYDGVVQQPERPLRELLAHLELPWEPACLADKAAAGSVRTASSWQVRQPLHRRSSGRWKNYERFLEPIREMVERA
jgi:tetratricopeptide (TPR) repeat protein